MDKDQDFAATQSQFLVLVVLNCAQEGVVDTLEDLVLLTGHLRPPLLVSVVEAGQVQQSVHKEHLNFSLERMFTRLGLLACFLEGNDDISQILFARLGVREGIIKG